MGLAASQACLLMLTMRMNGVEGSLQKIANEKLALSRQSSEMSEAYSSALDARKLVWSQDGSTQTDLTYGLLMSPSTANANNQYLVADSYGRVILNDGYANIFDPTGNLKSGNVGSVSEAQFLMTEMNLTSLNEAQRYIDSYAPVNPNNGGTGGTDAATAISNDMSKIDEAMGDSNFAAAGSSTLTAPVYQSLKTAFSDMLTQLQASQKTATTAQKQTILVLIKDITIATAALEMAHTSNSVSDKMAGIATIKSMIAGTRFDQSLPDAAEYNHDGLGATPYTKHTNDQGWACKTAYHSFLEPNGLKDTVNYRNYYTNNVTDMLTVLGTVATTTGSTTNPTSTTLSNQDKADFYINLYNQISSKGWVRNSSIDSNDGKYLQNLILNGSAYLYKCSGGTWSLSSSSDSESPILNVADDAATKKAEADYEAKKDRLDYKEKELDVETNNLDTERSAIQTEMDSVQKIIDYNIKKFKMFESA